VIVFRPPHEPEKPYIKRVIGEPGDSISYRDKQLYINGKPIPLADLGTYVGIGAASTQTGAVLFAEDLMGIKHDVLERPIPSVYAVDDFTVPDHHYFVMGDNRDNSLDSRAWGTVPDENLMGKAFMIWMHWEGGLHFDFSRIGTKVD
jgi:signal peptidase I